MINLAASLPSSLDLGVTGLRSTKGNILICLTANPKAFPNCKLDPDAHSMKVSAASASDLHFHGLVPGSYAISLIHDENGNGKLDTSLMIPREGFGFSRNPAISFGPPKFRAVKFAIEAGQAEQTVKMRYML